MPRPVLALPCGIEVDDQHPLLAGGQRGREVDRGRRLADAALLVGQGQHAGQRRERRCRDAGPTGAGAGGLEVGVPVARSSCPGLVVDSLAFRVIALPFAAATRSPGSALRGRTRWGPPPRRSPPPLGAASSASQPRPWAVRPSHPRQEMDDIVSNRSSGAKARAVTTAADMGITLRSEPDGLSHRRPFHVKLARNWALRRSLSTRWTSRKPRMASTKPGKPAPLPRSLSEAPSGDRRQAAPSPACVAARDREGVRGDQVDRGRPFAQQGRVGSSRPDCFT